MTDNEIIKALGCCSTSSQATCRKCPYKQNNFAKYCAFQLSYDALDLIKRQQADVELYRERANKYEAEVEVLLEQTNRQKAEIERFEHIKATIDEFWDILLKCKIAKRKESPTLEEFAEAMQEMQSEAIKEFAERVTKKPQAVPWAAGIRHMVGVDMIELHLKKITDEAFSKVEHNSLCETETYEGDGSNG